MWGDGSTSPFYSEVTVRGDGSTSPLQRCDGSTSPLQGGDSVG